MFNDIKPGGKVQKAQLKLTSDHFDKRAHNDEGYHPETFFISMEETLVDYTYSIDITMLSR